MDFRSGLTPRRSHISRSYGSESSAPPMRLVEAKLEIDPVMSGRDLLRQGAGGPGTTAADGSFANGWAGIIKTMVQGAEAGSDFTHPATMVFAQWQLPEVPAIIPNDDMIAVAFWVGLDGLLAARRARGNAGATGRSGGPG